MKMFTLLFTLGCTRPCSVGAIVPARQLSVEAIPGASTEAGAELDREAMSYEELDALTRAVQSEVLPDILLAFDVDDREIDQDLGPGGYLLSTSPAMQLKVPLSDAAAGQLAAGLGYAFSQESVLFTDWSEADGGTAFADVRFTDHAPEAEEAQAFFLWASEVNEGLGGGYTSFDDTLTFLNLRGEDGLPYSGLEDDAFQEALRTAADTWTEGAVALVETGEVESWLVANDWAQSPGGEDFLAQLAGDAPRMAALEAARSEHAQLLAIAAEDGGWTTP